MHNPDTLLHYFDALLKYSNFTRAAQELSISQPYLTQTIRRVEKKVGAKLLNRNTLPFRLTEAGNIYYQYLENVAKQQQVLNERLMTYTNKSQKIIRIGVLESLGTYMLSYLLPPFLKKHPDVHIQLFEEVPKKTEQLLLNNEIDCYIGQSPRNVPSGLKVFPGLSEPFFILVPQNSKFFEGDKKMIDPAKVSLKDLLSEPLVLSSNDSAIRRQFSGFISKYDIKPNVILETSSILTATGLCIRGAGITVSSPSIFYEVNDAAFSLYPLDPAEIDLQYFIAIKEGTKPSPALQDFVNEFQNMNFQ